MFGRGSKGGAVKKSEDVKKSAGKVLDTKKDTPTRAKVRYFCRLLCSCLDGTLTLILMLD